MMHILTEAMGEKITMDDFTPTLTAGDTVVISSDRTSAFKLYNIVGSSSEWITFTNPNTQQVSLSDNGSISTAIQVEGCRYIHLLGNNYSSETYGIQLTGNSGAALRVVNTRDIEIAYIELAVGGLNMSQCWAPWTCTEIMENVTIHHNYIHDAEGEGMYLGKSSIAIAPKFKDIQIYNNIIENPGWDGIQLGQTVGDNNNIYNNTIIHAGHGGTYKYCWGTEQYQTEPCQGQWFGIIINPEHHGVNVYRNYIEDSFNNGIAVNSAADSFVYIHDNVVFKAGYNGISVGSSVGINKVINNTVISSAKWGISTKTDDVKGELRYNLLVDNGIDGILSDYIIKNDNRIVSNVATENFVDAANGDFRLTSSSPAKDAGLGVGYSTIDFYGNTRPYGSAPDIGAIEYVTFNPCEGVECEDVCIGNDLYSRKCDPATGNCVTDTLIEANSPLCIISDPCEGITCSDVCIGNDLYSRKCIDGKCVTDQLLESDSLDCKLPTDEETIMKYITLGGLGLVAYIMLKMNKK